MTDIETDFSPQFKQDVSGFTKLSDFEDYLGRTPTLAQEKVFSDFLKLKKSQFEIRLSTYQEIHPRYTIKLVKGKIKFIKNNRGKFVRIPKYLKFKEIKNVKKKR